MGADAGGPIVRAGSEAGAAAPTCMNRHMHTVTASRVRPAGAASVAPDDNSGSRNNADRYGINVLVGGQELHTCAIGLT
jgi:hypothetical protein